MIESGVKTEEYREIKPYWIKRLCDNWVSRDRFIDCMNNCCINCIQTLLYNLYKYDAVKFSYGYTKRTMTFEIESITIGKGNINHTAQFPVEVRETLASVSALMLLTQCTWIVYSHLFTNMLNKDLQGMMSASYSLFQSYANQKANRINVPELNKIKAISSASQTLCDRILVYINLTKETANGKV